MRGFLLISRREGRVLRCFLREGEIHNHRLSRLKDPLEGFNPRIRYPAKGNSKLRSFYSRTAGLLYNSGIILPSRHPGTQTPDRTSFPTSDHPPWFERSYLRLLIFTCYSSLSTLLETHQNSSRLSLGSTKGRARTSPAGFPTSSHIPHHQKGIDQRIRGSLVIPPEIDRIWRSAS